MSWKFMICSYRIWIRSGEQGNAAYLSNWQNFVDKGRIPFQSEHTALSGDFAQNITGSISQALGWSGGRPSLLSMLILISFSTLVSILKTAKLQTDAMTLSISWFYGRAFPAELNSAQKGTGKKSQLTQSSQPGRWISKVNKHNFYLLKSKMSLEIAKQKSCKKIGKSFRF